MMMEEVIVICDSERYWQIPSRIICSTDDFTAGMGCTKRDNNGSDNDDNDKNHNDNNDNEIVIIL